MASQKERRAAPRTTAPRNAANSANAASSAPHQPQRAAASAKAALPDTETTLSKEDVYRMIAETAYFKAKARGFEPGGEVQDWIEAEAEVRHRIQNGDTR